MFGYFSLNFLMIPSTVAESPHLPTGYVQSETSAASFATSLAASCFVSAFESAAALVFQAAVLPRRA